jgi:hypothetical protein
MATARAAVALGGEGTRADGPTDEHRVLDPELDPDADSDPAAMEGAPEEVSAVEQ